VVIGTRFQLRQFDLTRVQRSTNQIVAKQVPTMKRMLVSTADRVGRDAAGSTEIEIEEGLVEPAGEGGLDFT